MKITREERLMYQVMKAISDSGIPIDFKGAMVLRACLNENGFANDTRHTMDIDANWTSINPPTPQQMLESLSKALAQASIDMAIKMTRAYGSGRSAGFTFYESKTEEPVFSMDMDVNRPVAGVKIYTIGEFRFRGVVVWQILADKISVASTDKVFRRIKDIVDLYYLSQCVPMETEKVFDAAKKTGRRLGDFAGFLNRSAELIHAYEKFRFGGGIMKPEFDKLYQEVKKYIVDFLPVQL